MLPAVASLRIALLAPLLGLLATACEPTPAPPPSAAEGRGWNLVLVTLDTTRADALGSYGQERPTTPQIDRLAAGGALFESAQSTGPTTLPSHATLLTGRIPPLHGVRSNVGYALAEETPSLAQTLGRHGYVTAAEIASEALGAHTGIARHFDEVRDARSPGVEHATARAEGDGEEIRLATRPARDVSRHALAFLREHAEKRFFLWLHYFDPHSPYSPPRTFHRMIPDSAYHAEVAAVDSSVGLVVNELERLGLRERSLVVVTADHGEGLGEHGEESHSYFLYQSTLALPLVFWGPPELAARRVTLPVGLDDVAPTILDLLELPPLAGASGRSLRPLVEGTADTLPERLLYAESVELARVFGRGPLRSLRSGRWKLVDDVRPELYDLAEDPGERVDLATRRPERVAALRGRLRDLMAAGDAANTTAVDPETAAELAALGYAAGASRPDPGLARGEPTGPPARSLAGDVRRLSHAQGRMLAGEPGAAAPVLADLAARHPESGYLAGLAGSALLRSGRRDDALPLLERARRQAPDDVEALRSLARARVEAGDAEGGIAIVRELLARAPCDPARTAWRRLLHADGRYAEELDLLEEGAARCPDDPLHLNNLAWALATSPEPALRDGARALALARRALELGGESPNALDTLAAAQAAAGRPAEAVASQREALRRLREAGAEAAVLEPLEARLRDYLARARAAGPAAPLSR